MFTIVSLTVAALSFTMKVSDDRYDPLRRGAIRSLRTDAVIASFQIKESMQSLHVYIIHSLNNNCQRSHMVRFSLTKDTLHLVIATSCSMMMTFGINCALEHLPVRNSLFQTLFINILRDTTLFLRCVHYDWKSNEECVSLLMDEMPSVLIIVVMAYLIFGLSLYYDKEIINHARHVVVALWTTELLGRCFDWFPVCEKVDVLTIHLFVWQGVSLVWRWMLHHLESPVLLIEQGASCLFVSTFSSVLYNSIVCYIPKQIVIIFYWVYSALDIVLCLHPRGYFRNSSSNAIEPFRRRSEPGSYYVGVDGERIGASLGFGDFLAYNLLILTVLPTSSSTATKIYMALAGMVSIEIGFLLAEWMWKQRTIPGLPLPVIAFSLYALLVDVIRNDSNECH